MTAFQKAVAIIGFIVLVVSSTVGAVAYFTPRADWKASCTEYDKKIVELAGAFQQSQISYQIDQALSIMWKIEAKYGHSDYNRYSPSDRDIYLKMKRRVEELQ